MLLALVSNLLNQFEVIQVPISNEDQKVGFIKCCECQIAELKYYLAMGKDEIVVKEKSSLLIESLIDTYLWLSSL